MGTRSGGEPAIHNLLTQVLGDCPVDALVTNRQVEELVDFLCDSMLGDHIVIVLPISDEEE